VNITSVNFYVSGAENGAERAYSLLERSGERGPANSVERELERSENMLER